MHPTRLHALAWLLAPIFATLCTTHAVGQQQQQQQSETENASAGPVRLTAPRSELLDDYGRRAPTSQEPVDPDSVQPAGTPRRQATEFEQYVSQQAGVEVRRLGSELMVPSRTNPAEANRQVPPDYIIGVGDELQITAWGSIDADLRLTVDRAGRIVIPRVGPVAVAGVRYSDVNDLLTRRVGQTFRNFQLSATLGKLRGIRYYVTGFTPRPGAYTVTSLATVMTALIQAGGPSAAGSFRNIELRRGGKVVSHFDLYDLLVRGDKSSDVPLQADDVLHIGPIGPQVAVLGSVNKPTIIELRGAETVRNAFEIVGGPSAVADRGRIAVERLVDRNDRRVIELSLPSQQDERLADGDVLRLFSIVGTALPQHKQYKRVRIEGEVVRPGDYVLPPASTLADAIQAAGGLTPDAFVFGTDFSRESVRRTQQENYERALRDLEIDITKNATTRKAASADEAGAQVAREQGGSRLVDRLRAVKPTGRIVLQLEPASRELPGLPVEEGDRLYVPPVPKAIGVFGSVFNAGSYLLRPGASVEDMLKLAGGPTRGADTSSIFVLRANGSVFSARQTNSGWFSSSTALNIAALPGDTVFVPEELNKTTFIQEAKDWTQILYQFGLGAAALKTIKN